MSLIQTPWTSQPQQAVGIDWGNPITRGLVSCCVGGNPLNLATNKLPVSGTVGRSVKSSGVADAYTSLSSDGKKYDSANLTSIGGTVFVLLDRSTVTGNNRIYSDTDGTFAAIDIVNPSATPNVVQVAINANPTQHSVNFNTIMSGVTNETLALAFVIPNTFPPSDIYGYKNGVFLTDRSVNGTGAGTPRARTAYSMFGNYALNPTGVPRAWAGNIYCGYVFNRALSDAEIRSLSQNPWQIFRPLPRRIFVPVTAGDPTLYPSLYSNTNSFYAPTISVGAVTLTPSLFSNSNTFHSATVTLGGSTQTLTPSLYSNANTFYGPSVIPGAVTLTPALFSNTNSFFGAVVTLDSDKILYPSLVSNSNSFYGPTVSVGAVSLLPSLFVNSNTFYNHVVGGALTDSEKIDLILDILSNRQTLDSTTGLYTLYADDGVTVIKTAQAWEDAEGTQPYRGRGLKRLDALQ